MRPLLGPVAIAAFVLVSCSPFVKVRGALRVPADVQSRFSSTSRGAVIVELQFLDGSSTPARYRVATVCGPLADELRIPIDWHDSWCVEEGGEGLSVRAFVAPVGEGDAFGCNDVVRVPLDDATFEEAWARAMAVGSQDLTLDRAEGLHLDRCLDGTYSPDVVLDPLVAP